MFIGGVRDGMFPQEAGSHARGIGRPDSTSLEVTGAAPAQKVCPCAR